LASRPSSSTTSARAAGFAGLGREGQRPPRRPVDGAVFEAAGDERDREFAAAGVVVGGFDHGDAGELVRVAVDDVLEPVVGRGH
jgi:hypothetical protein